MHVYRSKNEPRRTNPSWRERWAESDKGLIVCWDRGREIAERDPQLAAAAKRGELVPLSWKGGGAKAIKPNTRYGCFYYLATWQGLRGDDLDINTTENIQITCTKYGTLVKFTDNLNLLG